MIKFLVNLFTSGVVDKTIEAIGKARDAKTEQERIAAEADVQRLRIQQQNRELGGKMTSLVQFLWAAPFILFNAKLIIWDKMLGWGVTDPLSQQLYDLQNIIVGFYFGQALVRGIIRSVRGS